MKVGDLVRKVKPSRRGPAKLVPLKCFGIVVATAARRGLGLGPLFKVDFGDYGVFWHSHNEIELCT